MATKHEIIGEEWKARAPELAEWAMQNLVNRKDVWGQYSVLSPSERRKENRSYKAMTLPRKEMRGEDMVTMDKLTRHFASRHYHKPQIIGLHEKSKETTSRWLGIDIDCHDADAVAAEDHARRNLNGALNWWKQFQAMGYDPLLIDSSGKGGYHLWVLLKESAPTQDVFALAKSIVTTWESNNLDEEPETFPKRVKEGSLGSWFRLPGLHHTHEHYGRIWSGDDWLDNPWLEGHAAIDALMNAVPGPPPPASTASEKQPRKTRRSTLPSEKKKASARKQRFKSTGKATICVDLDGVLADRTYTKGKTDIGEPIDGAVDFTRDLSEFASILILTSRFSELENRADGRGIEQLEEKITEWLDKHKFSYTAIWTKSAKPPAQAYIDDHGVYCCPAKQGIMAYDTACNATKALCKIKS
ncbi:MAG: hypothetical protein V3V12_03880 [Gammaproteobacteria bacterium]